MNAYTDAHVLWRSPDTFESSVDSVRLVACQMLSLFFREAIGNR